MKKFYLLFFLMLLSATGMQADPVTKETALKSAQSFLAKHKSNVNANLSLAYKSVRSHASKGRGAAAKDAYYYIFNNEDGGFVIVSGDDATDEILGYSDAGKLDANNIPEGMQELLDGYQAEITYARNNGMRKANSAANITEPSRQIIEPLIETKWGQNSPFNLFCFTTDDQQAVTGCVATALAQIMYYHKWPQSATTAIPAYSSYSELPATTFNWNAMKPRYSEPLFETDAQKNAVATLFQYCGHAVKMSYGTGGSGASTAEIPGVLKNYFGYQNTAIEINRSGYDASKWEDLIYHELQYARPVIYSATTSSNSAHAFICDGYDGYGLFHINWGWAGLSDGYFRLQALNPGAQGTGGSSGYGGYTLSQAALIGMSPVVVNDKVDGGEATITGGIETIDLYLTNSSWAEITSNEYSGTYNGYGLSGMRIYLKYRRAGMESGYDVGVGLFKGNELLETKILDSNYQAASSSWYSYGTSLGSFGKNLSDGKYVLKGIDRVYGTEEWVPSKNSDQYYITVEISNGSYTAKRIIEEKKAEIEVTKVDQDLTSNSLIKMRAYIKNNGAADFNGTLYLLVDNNLVSYEGFYIAKGAEDYVTFVYNGAGGSHNIVISPNGNGSNPIYTGTITLTNDVSLPTLTKVSSTIKNMVGSKIYGDLLDCELTLQNSSATDYEGPLTIGMWKSKTGGYGTFSVYNETMTISIPAGETKTIPIRCSLAIGDGIIFSVSDANGQFLREDLLTVTAGVVTWSANGERKAVAPTNTINVADDVLAINLDEIDINGVTITPNSNPNTIYYLAGNATVPASLNGKNVVKGFKAVGNITLQDGYNYFIPKMFTVDGTISYTRTTETAGDENKGWSTIVLPFSVDKVMNATDNQQIDWTHRSDSENKDFFVKEFVGLNDTEVAFENVENWMPNVPYIISVPDNGLVGKEMEFSSTSTKVFPMETCTVITNDYSFIGTPYEKTLSNVYVMNSMGTAFEPSEEATVGAGNAYFTVSSALTPQPTTIPISDYVQEILLGDANGDGAVNVSDAVLVVNYILGGDCPEIVFVNADVNGDGTLNVSDAVGIVSIILGQ
ncbi:MAG: C10 family peptidase [Prevotella sp.]|nr:C10 family peptidase [Prevotella sp.]